MAHAFVVPVTELAESDFKNYFGVFEGRQIDLIC